MSKKIQKGTNRIVLFVDDRDSMRATEIAREVARSQGKSLTVVAGVSEEEKLKRPDGMVQPENTDKVGANYREEGDYAFFMYRQLSATIVGAGSWKATDFSKEGVLKDSTKLLNRKPAFYNHHAYVGNAFGMVVNPVYVEAMTNSAGQKIPAGIDAEFAINQTQESRKEIITDLKSEYNPYNACSVGLIFNWESSHPFENIWDFNENVGKYMEDESGNITMVRRIATDIVEYKESSLVPFGADFFARQKDKNNEVLAYSRDDLVGYASLSEESEERQKEFEEDKKFFVFSSSKIELSDDSTSKPKKEVDLINNEDKSQTMEKQLIAFALAVLGKESIENMKIEDLPSGDEIKNFNDVLANYSKAETLQTELDEASLKIQDFEGKSSTLEGKVTELSEQITSLNATILGNKDKVEYVESKRLELVKRVSAIYSANVDGDVDEVLLDEIKGNSMKVLESKLKNFGENSSFSPRCADCESERISFRSSVPEIPNDSKEGEKGVKNETFELYKNLTK